MNPPCFHAHFKTVTQISPMRHVKAVQPRQARLPMSLHARPAAAADVGYASASQFSREFKRLFGRTPTDEIAWMRATFELPPLMPASVYVSSH